jgi:hypothetical protein
MLPPGFWALAGFARKANAVTRKIGASLGATIAAFMEFPPRMPCVRHFGIVGDFGSDWLESMLAASLTRLTRDQVPQL